MRRGKAERGRGEGGGEERRVDLVALPSPFPLPPSNSLPPSALPLPPSSVIILSAEDAIADTIRPRLDAAGAHANRVYVLPTISDLRRETDRLREAVDRVRNCRLIVVDPINAYVGPNDSHFHGVVRRILAPLTELAREKRLAVIAVAHLRKMHGTMLQRAAGSVGFVSHVRSVWTIARDPNRPDRNLLLPVKTNLTASACGLAFKIEDNFPLPQGRRSAEAEGGRVARNSPWRGEGAPATASPAIHAPRIAWDPTPIDCDSEEPLRPAPKPREPSPDRAAAHEFLRKALAAGPRPAYQLIREGNEHGFATRTLQRSIHEIGGSTARRGLISKWWWSLQGFETVDGAKLDAPELGDSAEKLASSKTPRPNRCPGHPQTSKSPQTSAQFCIRRLDESIAALDLKRLVRAHEATQLARAQRRKRRDLRRRTRAGATTAAAQPHPRPPPGA